MCLNRSFRVMYIQIPQVVANLIFSLCLQSIHWRGVGRKVASEDRGKKVIEYQPPHLFLPVCQLCSSVRVMKSLFFDLPFLSDIPVEALLILCIPCQVQLHLHLGLLTSSLQNWAASLYSSQNICPCFCCLFISYLPFSLTSAGLSLVSTQQCQSCAFLS